MGSLAFVVAPTLLAPKLASQPRLQQKFPRRNRTARLVCCERPPSAVATPIPEESVASWPSLPSGAAAGAQALLDDLAERPQYYLNVSGVLLGMVLSVIVLSATVASLDGLPLLPDALRVIGLAYIFWFLGKFLLNGRERQRLQGEIDEFVDVVRGDAPTSPGLLGAGEQVRQVQAAKEADEVFE